MSLKTQVAHGLKWQAISIVGRQLLSLVVFTTLARLLEPSAFGLIALVGVYLGFVSMFTDQGIGMALVQRQNLEPEHLDTAFWFNIGCAGILCLATVLLAGPVSALYHEPRLARLLQWSSVGLVIGATSAIHATLFVKAMDFRQPVVRGLIANAAGGAVGVGMALAGCGVWSLVGQQLAGEVAGAVFLWRISTYRPALRFSLPHLRQLFGFSSSVFATSILWYFSCRFDQIVIGRFAGMPMLGLYMIAGKIPNLASMVTQQPMDVVSLPALSRLQADHGKMRQAIYHGMELNAVVSFAVFVGLAAVASDLVPLLFGSKWAAAVGLCALLSLYALVNTLQGFIHPALLASGGVGKYVLLNLWHAIGVLAACVVGIQFGVPYLVLGLIVNSLIIAIPALLYLRRRIGLSAMSYCRPCLVPASASIVMVGMIWLVATVLPKTTLLPLLFACKITIGATAYLCVMLILRRATLFKLFDMFGHAVGFRSKQPLTPAPPLVGH